MVIATVRRSNLMAARIRRGDSERPRTAGTERKPREDTRGRLSASPGERPREEPRLPAP